MHHNYCKSPIWCNFKCCKQIQLHLGHLLLQPQGLGPTSKSVLLVLQSLSSWLEVGDEWPGGLWVGQSDARLHLSIV